MEIFCFSVLYYIKNERFRGLNRQNKTFKDITRMNTFSMTFYRQIFNESRTLSADKSLKIIVGCSRILNPRLFIYYTWSGLNNKREELHN